MSYIIVFLGEKGQAAVGDSGSSSTKKFNNMEGKTCTIDSDEKSNEFEGMP